MRAWMRDRGLLLSNVALFVLFFCGMALTGLHVYNSDQTEHGQPPVSFVNYLGTSRPRRTRTRATPRSRRRRPGRYARAAGC
jgi:hypothetical protein